MLVTVLRPVDRRILHGLSVSPRASFRDLGRAIGISDHTVGRRYRSMQSELGLRVTGRVVEDRLGWDRWLVRIKIDPAAVKALADTLASRSDTRWVRSASGGTEISCGMQTSATQHDALASLFQKSAAARKAYSVDAHLVLAEFSPPAWSGLSNALTDDELASLSTLGEDAPSAGAATTWTRGDEPLLLELQRDGRAPAAHLAMVTGWHESTVRRRIAQLHRSGALDFDIDLDEDMLGLKATAQLWLDVDPRTLESVAREIARHEEAPFVAAVSGVANLFIGVSCESNDRLYRFVFDTISLVPGVRSIETVPISRTYKRSAATR